MLCSNMLLCYAGGVLCCVVLRRASRAKISATAGNKLLADHQKALAVVLTSQAIGTVSPPLIDAGGVTKVTCSSAVVSCRVAQQTTFAHEVEVSCQIQYSSPVAGN